MSHTLHKYATTPPFSYTTLNLKWRGGLYSNIGLDYMPPLLSMHEFSHTVNSCLTFKYLNGFNMEGDKNCGIEEYI